MLQNIIDTFNNHKEINDKISQIESCKYCEVKDIRVLQYDSNAVIRAQILYDYDIEQYIEDTTDSSTGN